MSSTMDKKSISNNELNAEAIASVLTAHGIPDCRVYVYDTVDSTQDIGKALARSNELRSLPKERALSGPFLITADSQTKGRGRYGRSFYSPHATGIYMSLVISVEKPFSDFLSITTAAAVAVCRVIERHSHRKPGIKWVNDVWFDGKKACGILTEAVTNAENGLCKYVIIGIGMNLSTKDFPKELSDIAFSIDDMDIERNELIGEIASEVLKVSEDPCSDELFYEYKDRSLILGRDVWWMEGDKRRTGTAIDINRSGNLVVRTGEDVMTLSSGDVSVRPL